MFKYESKKNIYLDIFNVYVRYLILILLDHWHIFILHMLL
jgi:hypothetical protein